jgi:hypothetical protein
MPEEYEARRLELHESALPGVKMADPNDLPGRPVRSVVLPQTHAALLCDALEMPEERHSVKWAHRDDGLIDVRLSPADFTNLQSADDDGPHIREDGRLVVEGHRYPLTRGWTRRAGQTDRVEVAELATIRAGLLTLCGRAVRHGQTEVVVILRETIVALADAESAARPDRPGEVSEPVACWSCGHVHAGPDLAGICVGCPCSVVRLADQDDDPDGERRWIADQDLREPDAD